MKRIISILLLREFLAISLFFFYVQGNLLQICSEKKFVDKFLVYDIAFNSKQNVFLLVSLKEYLIPGENAIFSQRYDSHGNPLAPENLVIAHKDLPDLKLSLNVSFNCRESSYILLIVISKGGDITDLLSISLDEEGKPLSSYVPLIRNKNLKISNPTVLYSPDVDSLTIFYELYDIIQRKSSVGGLTLSGNGQSIIKTFELPFGKNMIAATFNSANHRNMVVYQSQYSKMNGTFCVCFVSSNGTVLTETPLLYQLSSERDVVEKIALSFSSVSRHFLLLYSVRYQNGEFNTYAALLDITGTILTLNNVGPTHSTNPSVTYSSALNSFLVGVEIQGIKTSSLGLYLLSALDLKLQQSFTFNYPNLSHFQPVVKGKNSLVVYLVGNGHLYEISLCLSQASTFIDKEDRECSVIFVNGDYNPLFENKYSKSLLGLWLAVIGVGIGFIATVTFFTWFVMQKKMQKIYYRRIVM